MSKLIYSKFPGTCRTCNAAFPKGEPIHWSKYGGAVHVVCPSARAENQVAPCWDCKEPGKFRNYAAASPVYCDICHAKYQTRREALTVAPFVPDQFDMDYEDRCADACGL